MSKAVSALAIGGAVLLSGGTLLIAAAAAGGSFLMMNAITPEVPSTDVGSSDTGSLQARTDMSKRHLYGEDVISGQLIGYGRAKYGEEEHHVFCVNLVNHKTTSVELYDINGIAASEFAGFYSEEVQLGDQTSASVTALSFCENWTEQHIGYNQTIVTIKIKIDAEKFPNGINTMRWKVKGRKVYDPRKDTSVGGNGTHRADDDATWEYSANTELCALDYARFRGYKPQPIERFDLIHVMSHANICDELVDYVDDNDVTQQEPRYECHGLYDVTTANTTTLKEILKSAAGKPLPNGSKLLLSVGAYSGSSVLTLTDDDANGTIKLRPHTPLKERCNTVRSSIIDRDKGYLKSDVSPIIDSVSKAKSGLTLDHDLKMHFVRNNRQCRRLCNQHLARVNAGFTIEFPTNEKGWLLYLGHVIRLTIPSKGIDKDFLIADWKPNGHKNVTLTLLEESPVLYPDNYIPVSSNATPNSTLPNVTKPDAVKNVTFTQVHGKTTQNGTLAWEHDLPDYVDKFVVTIYLDNNIVQRTAVEGQSITISDLPSTGSYVADVVARNRFMRFSTPVAISFDIEAVPQPTLTVVPGLFDVQVNASIPNQTATDTFELRHSVTDDYETATVNSKATNWTLVDLPSNTAIYLWCKTVSELGESSVKAYIVNTKSDVSALVTALDGNLEISNLSSDAQDTLDQFDRDITSNKTATETTNSALALLRQDTELIPNSLQSTFAGAIALIGDNIGFKAALLGYKNQVEVLEGQVTANSTSISQTASLVQIESMEVRLNGKIADIVGGDIDAALEAALGGLQGEMTLVKFFVGAENLDGEQTITSMLTSILLDGEYASLSEVNSIINSKGIEDKVNKTEFTPVLTRVNSHQQILESNTFRQSLTSFAFLNDELGSLAQRSAAAQIALINNQLAMAREDKTFKGALAVYQEEITTKTTENSASVESLVNEVARVDNDIASAIEYTRATVGYCIDENGNITDETDAIACVAANPTNQWVKKSLSEALSKVQITTADGQTASVSQLMQAFQTSDGGLIVRGGQVTDNNGFISGHINLNDGAVGENIFIGNFTIAKNGSTSENVQVALKYLADTDELIIPSGTLVLTNAQKNELSGVGTFPWVKTDYNGTWVNEDVNAWILSTYGRYPKIGDTVTITNNNVSAPQLTTKIATANGSHEVQATWGTPTLMVNGSLVVPESITTNALAADAISGKQGTFGGAGTNDNVVKLNVNPDVPIWFGRRSETNLTPQNSVWFLKKDGTYKKDVSRTSVVQTGSSMPITADPTNTHLVLNKSTGNPLELTSSLDISMNATSLDLDSYFNGALTFTFQFKNGSTSLGSVVKEVAYSGVREFGGNKPSDPMYGDDYSRTVLNAVVEATLNYQPTDLQQFTSFDVKCVCTVTDSSGFYTAATKAFSLKFSSFEVAN